MSETISPNATIAHYTILSKLGEGGMGEVYLAYDSKLSRKVALKLLPPLTASNEAARKRLLREARSAAALEHPNICAIYEVGEVDRLSYIAMQYVEGKTLEDKLKEGHFDLSETLRIAIQVADSLRAAHEKNIIHRDIKPSNLILTPRGEVKVLDFGLARFIEDTADDLPEAETKSRLTQPGTIIGTVPYMSPEQLRGEQLDPRSDIFSFGTLLYELVSGRRPFAAKSSAEVMAAILSNDPAPLFTSSSDKLLRLEQVIRRCLAKQPLQRYQSMSDLIRELVELQHGSELEPVVSSPDATTVRFNRSVTADATNKRVSVNARVFMSIVALALIGVGVTYVVYIRRTHATNTAGTSSVYDNFVRGKVKVGSENKENNEAGIKLLEQVIVVDPNYAPAYAELARAYNIKSFYFVSDPEEKRRLDENAEVAVEKALAINPNLAEAHFARGLIIWTHDNGFPHEQSIQSYQRAIGLDPNLDEAHHQLGAVYLHIGLFAKARDELNTALRINPNNKLARFRLGFVYLYDAKPEEALAIFKGIPKGAHPLIEWSLASTLFELGRFAEASALVEEFLKTYPDEGGAVTSAKAMLFAREGKEREAEESIQRAIDIGQGFGHFHHTAYNIASAYALLNKPELTVKWLEATADDGFPCYPLFVNDHNLDNVRKDPRFIKFMNRRKQQWEKYKASL